MTLRTRCRASRTMPVLAALGLAGGLGACGGSADSNTGSSGSTAGKTQLSLVGYSTPKKAYDKLIAAFETTPDGKSVTFSTSFGASGSQSRAVATGQPADIVAFSTPPDLTRLVKAGVVSPSWDSGPQKGIPNDSVVFLRLPKRNPSPI